MLPEYNQQVKLRIRLWDCITPLRYNNDETGCAIAVAISRVE